MGKPSAQSPGPHSHKPVTQSLSSMLTSIMRMSING